MNEECNVVCCPWQVSWDPSTTDKSSTTPNSIIRLGFKPITSRSLVQSTFFVHIETSTLTIEVRDSHEIHYGSAWVVCQKQMAGTSNYIPQILWDWITCPAICFWHTTQVITLIPVSGTNTPYTVPNGPDSILVARPTGAFGLLLSGGTETKTFESGFRAQTVYHVTSLAALLLSVPI